MCSSGATVLEGVKTHHQPSCATCPGPQNCNGLASKKAIFSRKGSDLFTRQSLLTLTYTYAVVYWADRWGYIGEKIEQEARGSS